MTEQVSSVKDSSMTVVKLKTVERAEIRHTISPYDLTSSDNPGSVISQPLFKGWN